MYNVIILDDHQLFIDGIVSSFAGDTEINIAGFACNGTDGLELTGRLRPHIVLLDIDFTKTAENGLDILKQIRKHYPGVKVLVLTGYCDKNLIEALQDEGADGFLLKNIEMAELRCTVIDICQGKAVFKYDTGLLKRNFVPHIELSERAKEIIRHLSKGSVVKEIARNLCISETTVNDHLLRAKRKLGAKNNVELVFLAEKNGLL